MALTDAYLITTKNLVSFLKAIRDAKAPERFTTKFLEQLGFKSTNDRRFVAALKALKLIDEAGVPTQRYFDYLDTTRSARVLADGIREAYEELFKVNTRAEELSAAEVKNKLKTLTHGQKSDNVLGLMASTFKALCEQADWSELTPSPSEFPAHGSTQETKASEEEKDLGRTPVKPDNVALQYNIQIVLPDSRDPAVFDAIFRSLREHLF